MRLAQRPQRSYRTDAEHVHERRYPYGFFFCGCRVCINPAGSEVPNPDPESGLYARSRDNQIVKVRLAPNSLAYQIGECTQVLTGGAVRATPHAVRAIRYPGTLKHHPFPSSHC